MKATIDIPDELYRRVKARSALEGQSLRAVAIQLFETWVLSAVPSPSSPPPPTPEEIERFPWLAVSHRYPSSGLSHDMDEIRKAVAKGWTAESTSSERERDAP